MSPPAVAAAWTLRPAQDADWPDLWPIWRAVVLAGDTYAYDPAATSEQARAGWLGPAPDEAWLTADTRSGAVLGTYRFGPNHAGPGAHVANASYMVASVARGRGVGRAMVEHSIARVAQAGFLAIQFNAVVETNVHAVRLYEQLGFRTVGVVPAAFRHPERGLVGLVIMHRDLADQRPAGPS